MRQRPKDYADTIEKSLGTQKAYEVAKDAREVTKKENWVDLPVGPVFYDKRDNRQWELRVEPLRRVAAFWDNVFGILRKRALAKGVKV